MRVIITNDDGVHSSGLLPLVNEISKSFKPLVVVPEQDFSGMSHALPITRSIRHISMDKDFYVLKGTPAACVRFAILYLLKREKAGAVIAGINMGPNLNSDVFYSGTVGAIYEGYLLGLPGIAVSLSRFSPSGKNYKTAAVIAHRLAKVIINHNIKTLLNVNVPDVKLKELKGIKLTRLADNIYESKITSHKDPYGLKYHWFHKIVNLRNVKTDTDIYAIRKKYCSITPLVTDLTNYNEIEKLKSLFAREF